MVQRRLRQLVAIQLVQKLPFYGTRKSSPFSRESVIALYREPAESNSHVRTHYSSNFHFNIILPSMPTSRRWYLSLTFFDNNSVWISFSLSRACYMSYPYNDSCFHNPKTVKRRVQVMKLSISLCNCLHPPYSQTSTMCLCLKMRHQVPHPYETVRH
jgi:hypothetical protein